MLQKQLKCPPIGVVRDVPQMADTHSRTSYLSRRPLTTCSPFHQRSLLISIHFDHGGRPRYTHLRLSVFIEVLPQLQHALRDPGLGKNIRDTPASAHQHLGRTSLYKYNRFLGPYILQYWIGITFGEKISRNLSTYPNVQYCSNMSGDFFRLCHKSKTNDLESHCEGANIVIQVQPTPALQWYFSHRHNLPVIFIECVRIHWIV